MNIVDYWAIFRAILGSLQVMGATLALVLLLGTGTNRLSVGIAILTLCCTLLSLILFRGK